MAQRFTGKIALDVRDSVPDWAPYLAPRAPKGSPNVLIVAWDDVGYGAMDVFGGPIKTPTMQRIADRGVRFGNFHTTALCSPTRASLLTGRNATTTGMATIAEFASGFPGISTRIPFETAMISEVLAERGYNTYCVGKWHLTPGEECNVAAYKGRWPLGRGFERFYGWLGGETNSYYPDLVHDNHPIEPPARPEDGYHLADDLSNRAIQFIQDAKTIDPDKPFFLYFAPGATHAPIHVPVDWIDRYKGEFDRGWDAVREETFVRQKQMGIIPPDCDLTPRPHGIPAWRDVPDGLKPVLARQMEIYAGFLEQTDHEIGRVVDALEDLGVLEDTLVYYIIGDNGASAEGTPVGCFNEMAVLNGMGGIETEEFLLSKIDDFGTPNAYNHYAVGWAHALCTPYQWTKQVASHWGGTRNGTIVHWPRGLADKGTTRNQFHSVIDVAPTILEAAGIPAPLYVNGIQQAPLEGVSMLPTLRDAEADESHRDPVVSALHPAGEQRGSKDGTGAAHEFSTRKFMIRIHSRYHNVSPPEGACRRGVTARASRRIRPARSSRGRRRR